MIANKFWSNKGEIIVISVIIPVYNVQDTLVRAVESVKKQTFPELEMILVNDGSKDNSGDLCDELAQTDSRIRVIHKENGGLSSARNVGIEAAKGDFITFLDSDDYFELTIFEQFSKALKQQPDLELFIFNVLRVSGDKQQIQESINGVSSDSAHNVSLLFDYPGINFYAWNKIYAANLFEEIRFPEGKLYEDTMPSYQATSLAKKIVTTTSPGIYYIQNDSSIVSSAFNSKQYDNVTERIRLLDAIKETFPLLEGKAEARVLDGLLSTGYKITTSNQSAETNQYYELLKVDAKRFNFSHSEVSTVKKWALKLLLTSPFLYKKLYKMYLGK